MTAPNNIFIYSNFDFSVKSAGKTRMVYYAKAIANKTCNVYLVSCSSSKISDENFVEIEPNIFVLEKKKLTKSFFGTISFVKNIVSFAKSKRSKNIFIFYPSPLVYLELFSLLYIKAIKGCPVFYELNEVRRYSSAFHSPITIRNVVYSLKKITFKTVFSFIELFLYFYSGLICISTSIEAYGKKYNKNTIRIPILTNPKKNIKISKNKYFNKSSFNIGFSGSVKPSKENLDDFLEVLSNLKNIEQAITFNICGPVSKIDYRLIFEEMTLKYDLIENVVYHGNLNDIELSTFLTQQNLLVIPRGYTLQNNYGFSTKLSDYLNHKKMILLTDISDNKLYIKDGINGFIVPPNNKKIMMSKLKYIIQNSKKLESDIIKNAYKTSEKEFNYILFGDKLRSFLT